jgi:hypothetical protein
MEEPLYFYYSVSRHFWQPKESRTDKATQNAVLQEVDSPLTLFPLGKKRGNLLLRRHDAERPFAGRDERRRRIRKRQHLGKLRLAQGVEPVL